MSNRLEAYLSTLMCLSVFTRLGRRQEMSLEFLGFESQPTLKDNQVSKSHTGQRVPALSTEKLSATR